MSSQLTGRRRAIVNRNKNTTVASSPTTNQNQSNSVDTSKKNYQPANKQQAKLQMRIWVLAILASLMFGLAVFFQATSGSASSIFSQWGRSHSASSKKKTTGNCEHRTYPDRRYYGLNDRPLPDFLDTEYVYGELPIIIPPKVESSKLCVDQTEWYDPHNTENGKNNNDAITPPALPFADGTNPSILKLVDNPRIDPAIRDFFQAGDSKSSNDPSTAPYYLATICMTNSQCSWNVSPEETIGFRLSTLTEPATVRTVLLVLNQKFETLREATIHTRIDAHFGGRRNKKAPIVKNQLETYALDDARLFTHKGQIWVSYREGKLFGYEKQVLNRLHFGLEDGPRDDTTKLLRASADEQQLTVTLLASEVETLCCGRNMALIDNVHTNKLQALTWVDPVTVVDVDTEKTDHQGEGKAKGKNRRAASDKKAQNISAAAVAHAMSSHRRLAQKDEKKQKKKSHMHGTNGFMVYLPDDKEYLGIGHVHRPPDRKQNDHARFGHHYTHVFFTISDSPPFQLKRLSPELLLPSHKNPYDGEIIQFWSGLELKNESTLAVAYGINDCEGAALELDLSVVEGHLRHVPEGKEVVDFMMPLK
ncbi:unnamed protein product [Pseudo-nitzschia multistriata]|uniref:Uncharacterized protein n=1 Tax=Pseudo-nitzschia multistriata TaxID=183589 RepID=A0A448Z0U4_9STRA|nr:unnamed protein product [Pseudo-nitzschia multistriata]